MLAQASVDPTDAADVNGAGANPTASQRKRERAARRSAERARERLAEVERLMADGRWEDDVEGVVWELVSGGLSTRSVPPLPLFPPSLVCARVD